MQEVPQLKGDHGHQGAFLLNQSKFNAVEIKWTNRKSVRLQMQTF
jgi:hypothetical protein